MQAHAHLMPLPLSTFAASAPSAGTAESAGLPPRHGAGRAAKQDAVPVDSAAQFLGQLDIRCEIAPGTVYR